MTRLMHLLTIYITFDSFPSIRNFPKMHNPLKD
jgi:hypothetical protein